MSKPSGAAAAPLSSDRWIGIAARSSPHRSRHRHGGWPLSPAIRNCDFTAVGGRDRARPPPRPACGIDHLPKGRLLGLATVLAVFAKLVAERANRYPQDDRRVSAIAAAMLHGVDDQVAFNLSDRLSDKGGNPESSACLAARGVSSRRLTRVTCRLPHPNCSKAIVLALAHCRRSTWSKLDRFRSEFVTLSRN